MKLEFYWIFKWYMLLGNGLTIQTQYSISKSDQNWLEYKQIREKNAVWRTDRKSMTYGTLWNFVFFHLFCMKNVFKKGHIPDTRANFYILVAQFPPQRKRKGSYAIYGSLICQIRPIKIGYIWCTTKKNFLLDFFKLLTHGT